MMNQSLPDSVILAPVQGPAPGHDGGIRAAPPTALSCHRSRPASTANPDLPLPPLEHRLLLGQEGAAGVAEILGPGELAGRFLLSAGHRQRAAQFAKRRLVIPG